MLPDRVLGALRHKRHGARLRMHPPVVLLALLLVLDRTMLVLMIVNVFGHLSMLGDAADLRMRSELLLQRIAIAQGGLLARPQSAQLLGRSSLPQANVHFVRTAKDVLVVQAPAHTRDALHPFRVVNLARVSLVDVVDANRLVVAAGYELPAGGRIVDVRDGGDVIEVDLDGIAELARIECVETGRGFEINKKNKFIQYSITHW